MEEIKNWATSFALTASELYYNFPKDKYLRPELIEYYKKEKMRDVLGRILRYLFFLVLNDIIEKNVTFKFPGMAKAYLEMVPVSGDDFVQARQNGAFQDIDYLASNFTGYVLYFRIQNKFGFWRKRLYVSKILKDRITKYTNEGKTW